jgi:hypothetical protein
MLRISLLAAGSIALAAASAAAAPLASADQWVGEVPSLVEPVHGCHRDVQHGPAGWHYHTRYSCRRISVPPPRQIFRGPVCREVCTYVGPLKTCNVECR